MKSESNYSLYRTLDHMSIKYRGNLDSLLESIYFLRVSPKIELSGWIISFLLHILVRVWHLKPFSSSFNESSRAVSKDNDTRYVLWKVIMLLTNCSLVMFICWGFYISQDKTNKCNKIKKKAIQEWINQLKN